VTDAEIDAAVQASRDAMTQHGPCGCYLRHVGRTRKPIWDYCDYHEGYEAGLRGKP
jgi:hypothetical protein